MFNETKQIRRFQISVSFYTSSHVVEEMLKKIFKKVSKRRKYKKLISTDSKSSTAVTTDINTGAQENTTNVSSGAQDGTTVKNEQAACIEIVVGVMTSNRQTCRRGALCHHELIEDIKRLRNSIIMRNLSESFMIDI